MSAACRQPDEGEGKGMTITSPYGGCCRWLKGNLHTHTTLSDGTAPTEEVIEMYRDDGYDFLALTDHDIFNPGSPDGDEMILLPAQECHVPEDAPFGYHVVSIGETGRIARMESGQAIIDEINARGGLAIVCHPRWSFMPYELFDELKGYAAFEVYSGLCDKIVGRGFSNDYWDRNMTLFKKPRWAVAVDDTHKPQRDFATGWIWVQAERKRESILGAIARGAFYATSGPRIETIRVDESSITLHTSSARAVKFISTEGRVVECVEGEHVKVASYRPSADQVYIRAEVHAHDGTVAWTNPFFIEA